MRFLFFTATAIFFGAIQTQARPVSYPGGWTYMTMNNVDINSSHIHYSPSAKYSVGWRHEYLRGPKAHIDTLQINNLLKRWNAPGSQANLYLKSGFGAGYEDGDFSPAAFTGLSADWEDRRFFVRYQNRFFWADGIEKFATHAARIGIAPYIGDYGDLHTWLMLDLEYDAGRKDSVAATPLVRLFKGADLIEAGYTLNDGLLLNYIHRF